MQIKIDNIELAYICRLFILIQGSLRIHKNANGSSVERMRSIPVNATNLNTFRTFSKVNELNTSFKNYAIGFGHKLKVVTNFSKINYATSSTFVSIPTLSIAAPHLASHDCKIMFDVISVLLSVISFTSWTIIENVLLCFEKKGALFALNITKICLFNLKSDIVNSEMK